MKVFTTCPALTIHEYVNHQFKKTEMKKKINNVITKELLIQFIIQVLFIGIIIFSFQNYIQNAYAPITASETLKRENFLNSKRDTYFQALELLNRNLSNSDFINNRFISYSKDRLRGSEYPTEIEVNSCFSKLCIYSENDSIPMYFSKMFIKDSLSMPISEMSTFVKLLRKDLGYGDTKIDSIGDRYKFIAIYR